MKMVKSLLLGTAAGLVAMTGAQAADLPVKAKPVQYVKICSLYGAGFYYIPGTDTCIKVGGWVRSQITWNDNGSMTNGALIGNLQTRATNNFTTRVRGYITADARNQTEYGTLRSYIAVGTDTTDAGGGTFSSNRAFIQLAGFTFGLSASMYDFYSGPAMSLYGGKINPSSDTGDGGAWITAYTAQLGGGLSASLSIEQNRNMGVWNTNITTAGTIALPASSQKGRNIPDFVGNIRLDQAWGGVQIMGAIHDVSGLYYGANTNTGNPSDKLGWAVGVGVKLLAPFIAPGDWFQAQFNYSQGAAGYTNAGTNALYAVYQGGAGGKYSYGIIQDAVYGASPTSIELTTAWNVNAGFEHFWTKKWQQTLYGSYAKTSYNANANAMMCAQLAGVITITNGVACNNDFSYWAMGSRLQFNIDSSSWMALDVVYTKLNTASKGAVATVAASPPQPAASRTLSDVDAWTVQFQIRRNFYP